MSRNFLTRCSVRVLCTSSTTKSNNPVLTKLSLASPKMVEVEFDNGEVFRLSAEFLRVQSPAADSKRRMISGEKA